MDGEEAELAVDVGIGDVLLDIVVTLEPHGKDLAPGEQRLGFEALFLSHGAALRGLQNDRVERLRQELRTGHSVPGSFKAKPMGFDALTGLSGSSGIRLNLPLAVSDRRGGHQKESESGHNSERLHEQDSCG